MRLIAWGQARRMRGLVIVRGASTVSVPRSRARAASDADCRLPIVHSARSRSAFRGTPAAKVNGPLLHSRARTPASVNELTARWIVDIALPVARAMSVNDAASNSSMTISALAAVRVSTELVRRRAHRNPHLRRCGSSPTESAIRRGRRHQPCSLFPASRRTRSSMSSPSRSTDSL